MVVALALATDTGPEPEGCPACAGTAKASTGERAFCGVHVCADCGRMHLGEPRPCPGGGVPVPQEVRRG